jgi:hypothetical protein
MRLAALAFGEAQRPELGTLLSFSSRTAASVEPRSPAFSYQSLAILMSFQVCPKDRLTLL